MSNSGYDPFDYGLIKPEEGEETGKAPQGEGDPEDMLFATDGSSGGDSGPDSRPERPAGAQLDLDSPPALPGPDDLLFGQDGDSLTAGSNQAFDSAPPATFEEPVPRKQRKRPRKLELGRSNAVESQPKPSGDQPVSPPWLHSDARQGRVGPVPVRKGDPESRLSLKVASPGVSHRPLRSKGGSKLLPVLVLLGGLAGGAYLHLVMDMAILAGLVCAMGLIGSMFCAVLLRSKPL